MALVRLMEFTREYLMCFLGYHQCICICFFSTCIKNCKCVCFFPCITKHLPFPIDTTLQLLHRARAPGRTTLTFLAYTSCLVLSLYLCLAASPALNAIPCLFYLPFKTKSIATKQHQLSPFLLNNE